MRFRLCSHLRTPALKYVGRTYLVVVLTDFHATRDIHSENKPADCRSIRTYTQNFFSKFTVGTKDKIKLKNRWRWYLSYYHFSWMKSLSIIASHVLLITIPCTSNALDAQYVFHFLSLLLPPTIWWNVFDINLYIEKHLLPEIRAYYPMREDPKINPLCGHKYSQPVMLIVHFERNFRVSRNHQSFRTSVKSMTRNGFRIKLMAEGYLEVSNS